MIPMLRQLLVHFDDSPAALARLRHARSLAAEQGALVTALYAVSPWLAGAPAAPAVSPVAMASLRRMDEERMLAAKQAFTDELDEQGGPRARWAVAEGWAVERVLHEQALYADLVVLGQQHDPAPVAGVPFDLVETTVVTTGKPVLVVPPGAKVATGRTVVIAWKPTREAASAIAAAMPLIHNARAVHVVALRERGEEEGRGIRGAHLDLDGWLRLHGIQAQWHREDRRHDEPLGRVLLDRAMALDATLLVMGCYGHSRVREWMLGGVSRTVLEHAALPVLMKQ